jgi:hypothetical protein
MIIVFKNFCTSCQQNTELVSLAFLKVLMSVDMLALFCVTVALVIFLLLGILLIVFPYDYSWTLRISDKKKIEMLPGPRPVPFFGNILMFNIPPNRMYKPGRICFIK